MKIYVGDWIEAENETEAVTKRDVHHAGCLARLATEKGGTSFTITRESAVWSDAQRAWFVSTEAEVHGLDHRSAE